MKFYKYQGTGNDFIMIDNRDNVIQLSQLEIARLCHRRFGIGADGLIFLENQEGYDFKMVYHNADGAEGSMCGNGGRCTVRFAYDLGVFEKQTSFIAVDGAHEATINDSGIISLKMQDLSKTEVLDGQFFCNTGSPHVVEFLDSEEIDTLNVVSRGKEIRNNDFWTKRGGTNVNFVKVNESNQISVRTFERGVEDETYSCGTGVTACAIISHEQYGIPSPITTITLGGELSVSFEKQELGFNNIWLTGPAVKVFEGIFDI